MSEHGIRLGQILDPFGDGLGLDSVDALELAIAIDKKFGVRLDAEDENTKNIFRSARTLAEHVAANRAPASVGAGSPGPQS